MLVDLVWNLLYQGSNYLMRFVIAAECIRVVETNSQCSTIPVLILSALIWSMCMSNVAYLSMWWFCWTNTSASKETSGILLVYKNLRNHRGWDQDVLMFLLLLGPGSS